MAEFKREFSYEGSESEKGEDCMSDGTHLGTGFVGGLLVGGLAGWAFSRDRGYAPYPMNGHFVGNYGTDVQNIIATKDSQYAQLLATQEAETNTIDRVDNLAIALSGGLASLGYENARLSNANQVQTLQSTGAVAGAVAEASAKADLCCCQTQGLIKESTAKTQAMVENIVPQMQNFYLADEVEKLRIKSIKDENAYQYRALATEMGCVGKVVEAIYNKVNTTP